MATATLSPPPEEITEEVTVTTTETPLAKTKKVEKTTKANGKKAKKTEIVRVEKARKKSARKAMKRAAKRAKAAAKRSWKSFLKGLSKMRRRMIRLYSWAKSKARQAWMKTKKYAKLGISKSGKAVKYSGTWMKDAAVGAWQFTAPVRTWIATPFRMALTTSGGLAALLVFGGRFILGFTVIWLAYLLISGRMVMTQQTKVIKVKNKKGKKVPAKKARKLQAQDSVTIQIAPDTRVLTDAQRVAINNRIDDLEKQAQAASAKGNKNMFSEAEGRVYLAGKRLQGSTVSVNQLAKDQKAAAEKDIGVEKAREVYTWTAVKRGMQTEHNVIEKLMDTNSDSKLPASV